MNNKGNAFLGIFLCLGIWFAGILAIPYITDVIDYTRTSLSCSSTGLTFLTKMFCLSIDTIIPYFIYCLLVFALGLIAGGFR